jgi:branched-chain amino acid transport system substrate-binding protein
MTGTAVRRLATVGCLSLLAAITLAACSNSPATTTPTTSAATTTTRPSSSATTPNTTTGVTPTQIRVGAIATRTGVGAGDFASFIPGVQAYFTMINKAGGIDGRKLVLAENLDDGGSPSTFSQLAHTLLEQDNVFAAFISTFWFTPNLFAQTGTPTYGYNVSGNWAGPDNLFAAGGSTLDYHALAPPVAYLLKRDHTTSVAMVSYGPGIPGSYPACSTTAADLTKAGIKVSYADFDASLGGSFTSAVQQMRQHGSDFLVSCIEDTDDITLARTIQQYGLSMGQLWLNGYDQALLDQYSNLMNDVYVDANGFVPFSAVAEFPGSYPGMEQYLSVMKKYQPNYVTNQLAMQGWQSAALLAAGVRAAGSDLTQANLIAQTNRITDFTAGGITAIVNWTRAHTTQTFPNCPSFVQVKGTKFVPVVSHGHQVFLCFGPSTTLKNPTPVAPPPGTPGT